RSELSSVLPESKERAEGFAEGRKPSIAVLPFVPLGAAGPLSIMADALADELITDLSRLRWILVIARGSAFRFRNRSADPQHVGHALDVEYCLSGSLNARGGQVCLTVELARTSDNAIVWADRFIFGAGE